MSPLGASGTTRRHWVSYSWGSTRFAGRATYILSTWCGGANFLEASAAASCGLRLRARARALRRARGTTRFLRDHDGFTASVSTTWGTLSLAAPLLSPVRQLLAVGRDCVKFVRSVHRPAALHWRGYQLRSWCDSGMAGEPPVGPVLWMLRAYAVRVFSAIPVLFFVTVVDSYIGFWEVFGC